jgi:exonuclease V gamma subunit
MTISDKDACCCQNFCSDLLENFITEIDEEQKTAKQKRFTLYKIAANFLGFKSRTPLPKCIVEKIKEAWPESDNV